MGFKILFFSSSLVVYTTSKVFFMNIQFSVNRSYILDGYVCISFCVFLGDCKVQSEDCVTVVGDVEVVKVFKLVRASLAGRKGDYNQKRKHNLSSF